MLKSLKFNVDIFNGDQRVFKLNDFSHEFSKGLTAITGRNGSGKSMIPEMIQCALFGSKALRGKSDDYRAIEIELEARINGKDIRIERSKANALLQIEGQDSASGTSAVNQAIIDLFGYSLDVFNVANIARQGEIEKLGNMKPAERKRLVDEIVGLNILDALESFITGEIKTAKSISDLLGDKLDLPEKPILNSKKTLPDIDSDLETLRHRLSAKGGLLLLAGKELGPKPVEPEAPAIKETLQELQEIENERNRLEGRRSGLELIQKNLDIDPKAPRPKKPKAPTYLDQEESLILDLKKLEGLQVEVDILERAIEKAKVEIVDFIIPDPDKAFDQIEAYDSYLEDIELREILRGKMITRHCPKCDQDYEEADPRLKELEALKEVPAPEWTVDQIRAFRESESSKAHIESLDAERDGILKEIEKLGKPDEKLLKISAYREVLRDQEKYQKFDDLQKEIDQIIIPESRALDIAHLRNFELAHTEWFHKNNQWIEDEEAIRRAKEELLDPKFQADLPGQIAELVAERDIHIRFDQEIKAYEKEAERIGKENERIDQASHKLDQWKRCRQAVMILRAKVKSFLLPSLNKAASHLLSEMTDGQFGEIKVSEEFEISIDGQRMETLSGGGKAVANLALRLALGQVLTNRVFSTVMLDEIDASCDDSRAASMAGAVRNLSSREIIDQIILISHKPGIDADHYLRMEEF